MSVLITGGLGYIGSHIVESLLKNTTCIVVVLDIKNYDERLFNWEQYIDTRLFVYQHNLLSQIPPELNRHNIKTVIHCASLKSVPESVVNPLLYYESNIMMTLNLLKWMEKNKVYHLIYSSSATLYGDKYEKKFEENDITFPSNPYGNTKMVCEKILKDVAQTNEMWRVLCLRYFNPAVSYFHVDQGNTGLFTAIEKIIKHNKNNRDTLLHLTVNTVDSNIYSPLLDDGTCVRDYIHIDDLTDGHIKALSYLQNSNTRFDIINLGSETGFSTLSVAKNIEAECSKVGISFPYKIGENRPGDPAVLVSNCQKAKTVLDWTPKRSLYDICRDVVKNSI